MRCCSAEHTLEKHDDRAEGDGGHVVEEVVERVEELHVVDDELAAGESRQDVVDDATRESLPLLIVRTEGDEESAELFNDWEVHDVVEERAEEVLALRRHVHLPLLGDDTRCAVHRGDEEVVYDGAQGQHGMAVREMHAVHQTCGQLCDHRDVHSVSHLEVLVREQGKELKDVGDEEMGVAYVACTDLIDLLQDGAEKGLVAIRAKHDKVETCCEETREEEEDLLLEGYVRRLGVHGHRLGHDGLKRADHAGDHEAIAEAHVVRGRDGRHGSEGAAAEGD